jgi:hypothetical protein
MRKLCTLGTGALAIATVMGTSLAAHASDVGPAVKQKVDG